MEEEDLPFVVTVFNFYFKETIMRKVNHVNKLGPGLALAAAVLLAGCGEDAGGGGTITVPEPTVKVTPSDVLIFGAGLFVFDGETVMGELTYMKRTDYSQDAIRYMYFSKAASITGTYTTDEEFDEESYKRIFAINAKRGWNRVWVHIEERPETSTRSLRTEGSPSGLLWTVVGMEF